MKTYFDVGANHGEWGFEKLNSDNDCRVFAFEPTPELCAHIKSIVGVNDRYKLIEKAVSDVPGQATFHLSSIQNWGCSSLLPHRDVAELEHYWKRNLWHIQKTGEITVDCITMRQFVIDNDITSIDFFHCDVQGMDLRVLQSFGDKIDIVQAGELECAAAEDRTIYQGQTSTVASCTAWLEANGFFVSQVKDNDTFSSVDNKSNEFNLTFCKKDW